MRTIDGAAQWTMCGEAYLLRCPPIGSLLPCTATGAPLWRRPTWSGRCRRPCRGVPLPPPHYLGPDLPLLALEYGGREKLAEMVGLENLKQTVDRLTARL